MILNLRQPSWLQLESKMIMIIAILRLIIKMNRIYIKLQNYKFITEMNLHAAPAWTLQGARTSFLQFVGSGESISPGPSYNISVTNIKNRAVSFSNGRSRRSHINQGVLENPSPAHYNPKTNNNNVSAPTFPKNQKGGNCFDQNPDPTYYEQNFNMVKPKLPNYSMGSKYQSILNCNSKTPGPGQYLNPQYQISQHLKSRKSKFGTQTRSSQPNLNVPGVGKYNVTKSLINNKNTIGKAEKVGNQSNKNPGPGTYKHEDQFQSNYKSNKGKSLGKRLGSWADCKPLTADAFNNYFKEPVDNASRSFNLSKANRFDYKVQDIPGPCDYLNAGQTIASSQNKQVSFTKGAYPDNDDRKNNPGPAHYEIKSSQLNKFTIPKSKSVENINKNPGVGKYNFEGYFEPSRLYKYKRQSCGNLIGKSQRTNFVHKNIAGVGDYNIMPYKNSGVSIPKAERFPKPNQNPGPASYHMHSTLSNFNLYIKKK